MAAGARSAAIRDQHPAGGRVRLHVFRPAAAAGLRSALDAGAGATERGDVADLHRDRAQPGAGAAAVRHRGVSRGPADGAPPSLSLARYQADFRPADLFDAGPAGYDAVFSLDPGAGDGMPQRTFAKPVEVQITGSILIYDLSDPLGGKGEPVKALMAQFPDLRRFIREGYVRYAFTRFGVPYVVSIQCLDSTPRARRLACREAYPVAERFLKALRIAGGQPSRPRMRYSLRRRRTADATRRPISPIARPATSSPAAAVASRAAAPTSTAYSQIRFPLEKAPAFVRSQSFGKRDKSEQPRRRSYPWRDNFCEARSFEVGQCASRLRPSGPGHPPRRLPGATAKRRAAAIPSSRLWSRCATAS